jgi:hypothetical protein
MTAVTPDPVFINELDRRCSQVALARVDGASLPEGIHLWSGAYASVLLWPVFGDHGGSFDAALRNGEAWFADYLSGAENKRNARVIDGYLLLQLQGSPEDALLPRIREAELSFKVCRKHVVWPYAGDLKEPPRLDAVTVLAVPEGVTAASGEVRWPTLDQNLTNLWDRIQDVGPAAVALAEGGS